AILRETALRSEHVRHAFDERKPFAFEKRIRTRLAVELGKLRFVIERVQVGGRAREMNINDAFCFRGKMWPRCLRRRLGRKGAAEERVEGNAANTSHAGFEKKPARLKLNG